MAKFTIATLNNISPVGLNVLGDDYQITDELSGADGILVRSAKMHDMDIPDTVLAVARAGAGTNNIPIDEYAEKGIVVFNTPGANANGVKELVLCAMLLASRKIVPGIEWCKTLKGQGDAVVLDGVFVSMLLRADAVTGSWSVSPMVSSVPLWVLTRNPS